MYNAVLGLPPIVGFDKRGVRANRDLRDKLRRVQAVPIGDLLYVRPGRKPGCAEENLHTGADTGCAMRYSRMCNTKEYIVLSEGL